MRALLIFVAASSVLSWSVRAEAESIDLGGGASVHRVGAACWHDAYATCTWWEPTGFSFGGLRELERATTFARTPRGRIVAMVPRDVLVGGATAPGATLGARVLYSDDGGARWREAQWPDAHLQALAISFDPRTSYGVAVGDGGAVWSSDDEGVSWRRRRSGGGVSFVAVWVRGRTVVIEDRQGALWLSRDGGFALASLAHAGAVVRVEEGRLVVADRDREIVVDAQGELHRD